MNQSRSIWSVGYLFGAMLAGFAHLPDAQAASDPADAGGECVVRAETTNGETEPEVGGATAPVASGAQTEPTLLFEDNFDARPDWTSGSGLGTLADYFTVRQTPYWAPSTGYPTKHEGIEILGANANMALEGRGKSAVFWRESKAGGFGSDKTMLVKLPKRERAVYAEFMIKFAPGWISGGLNKIYRVYSWDETAGRGAFDYFTDGSAGPMFLWDYGHNNYGARNVVALRGGPYNENYFMSPTPEGFPRGLNNGSAALNYTGNRVGQAPGGTTGALVDRQNGGPLPQGPYDIVSHEQVYGNPADGTWTKMAFYVEMNSAPGVADGKLVQWVNDERVLFNTSVPWLGESARGVTSADWNIIGIGGNEDFDSRPDAEQYEDWYSIDEFKIYDGVPLNLSLKP